MATAFQSNAFQTDAFQIDVAVAQHPGAGASRSYKKKKKKGKVIRYSDFESRDAYAAALQAAVIAPPMVVSVPMDEDDDLILALLARVLH